MYNHDVTRAGPEWDPFSARECNAQDQPTTYPHPTPSHRGGIWINEVTDLFLLSCYIYF